MEVKDALVLIEAIPVGKLTSWEKDFLKSITKWLKRGKAINEKQGKALEGIYRNSQGGGKYERKQFI